MTYLSTGAVQADAVFLSSLHRCDELSAGQVRQAVAAVVRAFGRAADGMTVSSRRRLLAHLRAGDGDAAALEMERHLRSLLYMRRLARPGSQVIAGEAPL
jgi:DNA-binding GntR family transcriptional regulator